MCGGAIISDFIVAKRGRELPTHDLWSKLDTDDLFSFPAAVTNPHLNSGSAGGEKSIRLKKRGAGPGKEEYEYLKMSIEGYLTGEELEQLALGIGFSSAKFYEIAGGMMGNLVATH